MSEKKVVKISLGTAVAIVIIILLLIVIIALGMYVYGIKCANQTNAENANNVNNLSNTDLNNSNEENNTVISLNPNDKLVQDLYNIVEKYNNMDIVDDELISKFSFYRDEKITLEDLSDAEKVLAIMNNIDETDLEKNVDLETMPIAQNSEDVKNVIKLAKEEPLDGYERIRKNRCI